MEIGVSKRGDVHCRIPGRVQFCGRPPVSVEATHGHKTQPMIKAAPAGDQHQRGSVPAGMPGGRLPSVELRGRGRDAPDRCRRLRCWRLAPALPGSQHRGCRPRRGQRAPLDGPRCGGPRCSQGRTSRGTRRACAPRHGGKRGLPTRPPPAVPPHSFLGPHPPSGKPPTATSPGPGTLLPESARGVGMWIRAAGLQPLTAACRSAGPARCPGRRRGVQAAAPRAQERIDAGAHSGKRFAAGAQDCPTFEFPPLRGGAMLDVGRAFTERQRALLGLTERQNGYCPR